jgi:hypothetical protein
MVKRVTGMDIRRTFAEVVIWRTGGSGMLAGST